MEVMVQPELQARPVQLVLPVLTEQTEVMVQPELQVQQVLLVLPVLME